MARSLPAKAFTRCRHFLAGFHSFSARQAVPTRLRPDSLRRTRTRSAHSALGAAGLVGARSAHRGRAREHVAGGRRLLPLGRSRLWSFLGVSKRLAYLDVFARRHGDLSGLVQSIFALLHPGFERTTSNGSSPLVSFGCLPGSTCAARFESAVSPIIAGLFVMLRFLASRSRARHGSPTSRGNRLHPKRHADSGPGACDLDRTFGTTSAGTTPRPCRAKLKTLRGVIPRALAIALPLVILGYFIPLLTTLGATDWTSWTEGGWPQIRRRCGRKKRARGLRVGSHLGE